MPEQDSTLHQSGEAIPKPPDCKGLCHRCRDDFYNGRNPFGS